MAEENQNGGAENGASKAVTFTAAKPILFVEELKASEAVEFYKAAFGAEELSLITNSKRKAEQELPLVLSAELKIGSSSVIVSDLSDDAATLSKMGTVTATVLCIETDTVEAAVSQAVKAGAVLEGEVTEGDGPCCGGPVGKLKDPYGYTWLICSASKKCAKAEA